MKTEMPTRSITFPERCVRCGANPTRFRTVAARKGFDLIFVGYTVETRIRVPICYPCDRRRRLAAWLIIPLTIFGSIALIVGGLALAIQDKGFVFGCLCALVGVVMMVISRGEMIDGMLDYWLVGVQGITHKGKGELMTLAIRDAKLSEEVQALTKEAESSAILLRAAQAGPMTSPQELLRGSDPKGSNK